ncbi:MAG TPA: phage tail protein [Fusobacterium sp.]|uniref:phage tail protein n=1 Tax=Fusobacterium sp. TaxID=68766 RepID=UPI002F40AF10
MITVDLKGIEKIIENNRTLQKELPGCISRAINRSLEMVKTEQIRKTQEHYHIKRTKLFSTVNIFKSSPNILQGRIVSGGRPIGLDHFKLTPNKRLKKRKILQVEVERTGLKSLPNAFIAYHSGKLGAFIRTTEKRYSIKRLTGPSAPQMLGNISILEYLQGYADEKFNMRLDYEVNRVMFR